MSKKLLFSIPRKDFRLEFYVGGGRGGQNRNKVSSCCHKQTKPYIAIIPFPSPLGGKGNPQDAMHKLIAILCIS